MKQEKQPNENGILFSNAFMARRMQVCAGVSEDVGLKVLVAKKSQKD